MCVPFLEIVFWMIKQSLNDLSEVTLTCEKIVFVFGFSCNLDYVSGL